MKNFLPILFLLFISIIAPAQEKENENHGTFKIQKKGQLVKVIFDDVNYRLVGIDQYGNVLDTAVVEFHMGVTIKGIYNEEAAMGYKLSRQMQQLLGNADQTSKIFFDKIKAKDRSGNIIEMPKFSYSIGSVNKDYDN